jgi:hypothetical protein
MARYILYGYEGNHWTIRAKALLKTANIAFDFEPVIGEVHPDGRHPLGIKKVPAIRLKESPAIPIADGIEEIEGWLKKS